MTTAPAPMTNENAASCNPAAVHPLTRLPFDAPLPGESARQFHAFTTYRDLGPARSVDAAHARWAAAADRQRAGKRPARTWLRWSSRFHWVVRARAFDVHTDQLRRGAEEQAYQEAAAARAALFSPATVRHVRTVLRGALAVAVKWSLITTNPASLTEPPKAVKYKVKALRPIEARALVDAFAGHPLETLVVTALATGMRQGELLGLRWEDVDLEKRRLTVRHQLQRVNGARVLTEPKSERSQRELVLPPGAVEMLMRQRVRQLEARLLAGSRWQEGGWVFTSKVGTPVDSSSIIRRFSAHLRHSHLPHMRFHDLRHGAAALMLSQGVTLHEISEMLGHSQLSMTADFYAGIVPELKEAAAEKMQTALFGS